MVTHVHIIISVGSAAPTARSKYVLDPSVQSSSSYGQSASMYAPAPQTFGTQPQTFGQQPQQTYGTPYSQPTYNQFVSNPVSTMAGGQPSILNPQPASSFAPGLPPIEVAQSAMQQNIQRNPTPPPGWNDPPALRKSSRPVCNTTKPIQPFHFLICISKDTRTFHYSFKDEAMN